jgi:hypothetical protein
MKGAKAGREQVVLGISASLAVVREHPLPFTLPEQIQKVIKFESESHLQLRHRRRRRRVAQGVGMGKARVLVFAVRKDDLKAGLGALDRIGIDPVHVNWTRPRSISSGRRCPARPRKAVTCSSTSRNRSRTSCSFPKAICA